MRTKFEHPYVESIAMSRVETALDVAAPKPKGQPAQSLKQLDRGFLITEPTPLVAGGELRLTNDVAGLYLMLLRAFSDDKRALLEDERAFVDAVYKHDVFLEVSGEHSKNIQY